MTVDVAATVQDLVALREARGLTAEDLHRQIKIHIDQVHALERGDWAALPGLPFVRGALRSYGRALDIDVGPLLAGIGGDSVPTDLKRASSLKEPIRRSGMLGFGNGGSGSGVTWIILSVFALAAIALFFGRQHDPSDVPSWLSRRMASAPPTATTDVATAPARVAEPAERGEPGEGPSLDIAIRASATPFSPEQIAVHVTPAQGKEQSEAALQLRFAADTLVSLSQDDGRNLLSGLQHGDSVSELRVKGPFTLVLPRSAAVRVVYDGRQVPIELPAGNTTFRTVLQ